MWKFLAAASLIGLARATVQGFDVSSYQATVDWSAAYASGARFVMIKVMLVLSPPIFSTLKREWLLPNTVNVVIVLC